MVLELCEGVSDTAASSFLAACSLAFEVSSWAMTPETYSN